MGAIFIDRGFDDCRDFIIRVFESEMVRATEKYLTVDYKSRLQELIQSRNRVAPAYRTVQAVGPDHAREFTVEVSVDGVVIGSIVRAALQICQGDAAPQQFLRQEPNDSGTRSGFCNFKLRCSEHVSEIMPCCQRRSAR